MASGSGALRSPLFIESDLSDPESDYEDEFGGDQDSVMTLTEHVEPPFPYVFHMQRPVLMPGVWSRHKRRRTSLPLTAFRDYPMSVLQEHDVQTMRVLYNIPESMILRIPSKYERAHNSGPDEIVVYEAYFALGMRETVPPLIANVASFFGISPGQFIPAAWRVLTAIQVLGEFSKVDVGMDEILYAYFFKAHPNDSSRCMIQPRPGGFPLVYDLDKDDIRRLPYEKEWKSKYLFMNVGSNPDFPVNWFFRGSMSSSIFDVPDGEGALEAYNQAMGSIASARSQVLTSTGDPQASKTLAKRPARDIPRNSSKPPKKKGPGSSSGSSLLAISDHQDALLELNQNSFPQDISGFSKLSYDDVFDESQSCLFQVMSACHYAKTQVDSFQKEIRRLTTSLSKMKLELNSERELHKAALATKDEAFQALKTDFEGQVSALKTVESGLRRDLESQESRTRRAAVVVAVITRFKMISEFKRGKARDWCALEAEKIYRQVMIQEAEHEGNAPPEFPETYTNFDEEEVPTPDGDH